MVGAPGLARAIASTTGTGGVTLAELVTRWRSDAERFRAWGQEYLARTLERAA